MATSTADRIAKFGQATVTSIEAFGRFWNFVAQTLSWLSRTAANRKDLRLLAPQLQEIGVQSVPVILITGAFVGMVLAVQTVEQFMSVGMEERMGVIINLTVLRELGPVLAGVMLAGRVGGALTAELGTMRVTEQLDALRAMGADPIRYLAVPRFLACLILTPLLTLYCDVLAALGGWFITVVIYSVQSHPYWKYAAVAIEWWDLLTGFLKSLLFGGAIGLISCYKGFTCKPGAEGVGRACTEAFVVSFVAILILDFLASVFMQSLYTGMWGFKSVF